MLPNDVFERQYDQAILALQASMSRLAPFALIDSEATRDFWRGRVHPFAVNACPFEIILHRRQRYDITIGPETYEERTISSVAIFAPLLEAVAGANLIVRRWKSAMSGAAVAVETLVTLADGSLWRDRRDTILGTLGSETTLVRDDQHFVPYKRATNRAA